MRDFRISLAGSVALMLALALGGCSKGATVAQAESAPTGSPSPAPAPAIPPAPVPLPPVEVETLLPFVPEIAGWTRGTPLGQPINTGLTYSKVNADYTKDESTIRFELCDSALNRLLLAPLSTMLVPTYSERSKFFYKQYAAVHNSPGFESWDSDAKEAEVTVVAGGRFIISARGTNMSDLAPVKALVQAIDLAKLSALK